MFCNLFVMAWHGTNIIVQLQHIHDIVTVESLNYRPLLCILRISSIHKQESNQDYQNLHFGQKTQDSPISLYLRHRMTLRGLWILAPVTGVCQQPKWCQGIVLKIELFTTQMQRHSNREDIRKWFYLVQLYQMWVGGVGWTQTFINHCFYGIFDHFLSKNFQ